MTGFGTDAWLLPLIGIHSAFAPHVVIETLEMVRILGNSYRSACTEAGLSIVHVRVALNLVTAVAMRMRRLVRGLPIDLRCRGNRSIEQIRSCLERENRAAQPSPGMRNPSRFGQVRTLSKLMRTEFSMRRHALVLVPVAACACATPASSQAVAAHGDFIQVSQAASLQIRPASADIGIG